MSNFDKHNEKAAELVRKMGSSLALRYVNANIAHWNEEELKTSRTESKDYWEIVKEYLPNYNNPFY